VLNLRISYLTDVTRRSEDRIRHVPWCVGYHAQDFPLEAFQYFDVGDGS
jgi:hypothetical protein